MSFLEKDYNESKGTLERAVNLTEIALGSTIQILYDKRLFTNFNNADEALKDYIYREDGEGRKITERRRRSHKLLSINKYETFLSFLQNYIHKNNSKNEGIPNKNPPTWKTIVDSVRRLNRGRK